MHNTIKQALQELNKQARASKTSQITITTNELIFLTESLIDALTALDEVAIMAGGVPLFQMEVGKLDEELN